MGRLIVNADDFGLTPGVNRAIVELHQIGLVTSATLMARAPATAEALRLALSTPSLGVGCHVVLADGEPILSAREIPHLANPADGRFMSSLPRLLYRLSREALFPGRLAREIEAETIAQIRLLQSKGVSLTHIDTHKHTHMFPTVLRPVLRAARAAGIRAIRNPFEPSWSVLATRDAPWLRRAEVNLLRRLAPAFRRIVVEEGFTTTDGSIGVLATGTLDARTVTSLLQGLRPGTWELVTHPGYNDAALAQTRTRLLASRDIERDALGVLRHFPMVELTSFVDLIHDFEPQPTQ